MGIPDIAKGKIRTKSDHEYTGRMGNYQTQGSSFRKQRYSGLHRLTPYQDLLYRRALFGLSAYSPEELKHMNRNKKKRIEIVNRKAQEVINLWKQHICNTWTNNLFMTFFPASPVTQALVKDLTHTDRRYINKLKLPDLNIRHRQIVEVFIKSNILPENFYELQEPTPQKSHI